MDFTLSEMADGNIEVQLDVAPDGSKRRRAPFIWTHMQDENGNGGWIRLQADNYSFRTQISESILKTWNVKVDTTDLRTTRLPS